MQDGFVFHRRLDRDRPRASRAEGAWNYDTAGKLAGQIHPANGQSQRYRVVSRWLSYHGSTLATLAVGGKTSPSMRPSKNCPVDRSAQTIRYYRYDDIRSRGPRKKVNLVDQRPTIVASRMSSKPFRRNGLG